MIYLAQATTTTKSILTLTTLWGLNWGDMFWMCKTSESWFGTNTWSWSGSQLHNDVMSTWWGPKHTITSHSNKTLYGHRRFGPTLEGFDAEFTDVLPKDVKHMSDLPKGGFMKNEELVSPHLWLHATTSTSLNNSELYMVFMITFTLGFLNWNQLLFSSSSELCLQRSIAGPLKKRGKKRRKLLTTENFQWPWWLRLWPASVRVVFNCGGRRTWPWMAAAHASFRSRSKLYHLGALLKPSVSHCRHQLVQRFLFFLKEKKAE